MSGFSQSFSIYTDTIAWDHVLTNRGHHFLSTLAHILPVSPIILITGFCSSADSRTYGVVPIALVQGRVLFRVWPLRGKALLQRGAPPRRDWTGFTVLPAGYEGQQIIKHRASKIATKTDNDE